MASLNVLPTELQCAIFCLLDPVGLISISQTNRAFRNIIQPTRKNFLERLLQLELDERQGGITPLFNPRTNALSPAWTEPEWRLMRWACSGCLRLLPAEYFDNHAILRLAYRKPISGSPASNPFTSWEATPKASPFLPHVRREQRLRFGQCIEEKRIRRRYGLAISNRWTAIAYTTEAEDTYNELQGCGWIAWEDTTLTEFLRLDPEQKKAIFDEEVNAIENVRCGYKRHLRKCHECRYQSGQLKPKLIGSGGIVRIPVVTSRQYRIPTIMDRYYPRFSEELLNKRPASNPPSYAIYRAHVRDRFWPMYMIRCPDCEKWKEQRMFMTGLSYLSSIPEKLLLIQIDELRCHQCYAEKWGPGQLGMALLRDVNKALLVHAAELAHRLGHGFHCLLFEPELREFPRSIRDEIHRIADEPDRIAKSKDVGKNDLYTPAELLFLRERYEEWMAMRAQILASDKKEIIRKIRNREENRSSSWFCLWMDMYDDLEAFYKWYLAARDEVNKTPEKLSEWALHGSIGEMPPVCTEAYVRFSW